MAINDNAIFSRKCSLSITCTEIKSRIAGPTRTPAIMYPVNLGNLILFMISETRNADNNITPVRYVVSALKDDSIRSDLFNIIVANNIKTIIMKFFILFIFQSK